MFVGSKYNINSRWTDQNLDKKVDRLKTGCDFVAVV